ncbi:MAG: T9SS type A sorting domain-containing protein, partial [Flavobacteriales bacterium]|nr:T9SS type A sorting domain-containing protein [Flavobacteriales bacterium]
MKYWQQLTFLSCRIFLILIFTSIISSVSGQSYFNNIYDYGAKSPQGSLNGNIEIVGNRLFTAGLRLNGDSVSILVSEWDVTGNLVNEQAIVELSEPFFAMNSEHFHFYDDRFYYFIKSTEGSNFHIICFTPELELIWIQTYDNLEGLPIRSLSKVNFVDNQINIGLIHTPDGTFEQHLGILILNLEGELDQTIPFQQVGDCVQVSTSDIHYDETIYISGSKRNLGGIEAIDGLILKINPDSPSFENFTTRGNPNHFDTPIFIEEFDDTSLIAFHMYTDSIYTGGLLPNEQVWYNHLETYLVDKNDLELSSIIDYSNYYVGNMAHVEKSDDGYGILGESFSESGTTLNSWFVKLSPEREEEFSVVLNYLECSGGCFHNLEDFCFDEYGNVYGTGYADFNDDELEGRYHWMVGFDCHGQLEEPAFNSGIDSLLTENGDYFLSPTSDIMDDYTWTVDNQSLFSENILLDLEPGIHDILLTTEYCGRVFEESITIDVPTNIEEQSLEPSFIIYPNPANGHFSIDIESITPEKLSIYSITGELILEILDYQKGEMIDVTELAAGKYVVAVESNG